jgi:protocatechuate 3,4-dioxygenase beta subunit
LPLDLSGKVLTTGGDPLPGAVIELWHADHGGHYDVEGFRFRAKLVAAADGSYRVSTVMPGHYPDRVCQHVHFLVKAPNHAPLVTQLYFASDPVFDGDPQANFKRDPLIGNPALIRPVALVESGSSSVAKCNFDLVLSPA